MIDFLISSFSNRELAAGFWLLPFACWLLLRKDFRRSLYDLIKTILSPGLLQIFLFLVFNVWLVCWTLNQFEWWQADQIKSIIFWYFLTGVFLLCRAIRSKEGDSFFRKTIFDNFKVIIIFQFIVVAYSFSLLTEIIIFPFIVFVSVLYGISESKKELKPVKNIFGGLLFIYTIVVAWHSISTIYKEPTMFWNTTTARDFILPILLSIGCLPCFYLVFIWNHIQQFNIRIHFKDYHTDDMRRYAKRRFYLAFCLRPWLLYRAARQFDFLQPKNRKDIENIVQEIKTYERLKNNPSKVKIEDGWSPYLAVKFLSNFGFKTDDYHKSGFNNPEWEATSDPVNANNHHMLFNQITYYIEGTEDFATKLKLRLHIHYKNSSAESLKTLSKIASALYEKATGEKLSEKQTQRLISGNTFNGQSTNHSFSFSVDKRPSSDRKYFIFEIKLK